MKKIWIGLLILLLVFSVSFSLPPSASALQILGDPIEGNSWFQGFKETNKIDTIKVTIKNEARLKYTGLRFSTSEWIANDYSDKHAVASGNSILDLVFQMVFYGDKTGKVDLEYAAYKGGIFGTVVKKLLLHYNGDGTSGGWSCYDPPTQQVPDASTMYLLGTALLGLWFYSRKKAKKGLPE